MLKIFVAALLVIYPALVYFGLAYLRPGVFGIALLVLALLRARSIPQQQRRDLLIPLILLMLYSLTIAISDSEVLLRFYPVIMNLTMLFMFAKTLWQPPTMIERLATMRGMEVSPEGRGRYVQRLTLLWCIFLAVNASIATYTALFSSLKTWAIYNGFLAYALIGILLVGEMLFRPFYKRRVAARKTLES